jgi:hypothetical protein
MMASAATKDLEHSSWTDADVSSAREAFRNCKAFAYMWPSNYDDVLLVASLENAKSLTQINELERTYIAYMRALEPFQPQRSEVEEQKEKLLNEINSGEDDSVMKQFMAAMMDRMPDAKHAPMMYEVPYSGTYWVKGVPFAREQATRARSNMYIKAATFVVVVGIVALLVAFVYKKIRG